MIFNPGRVRMTGWLTSLAYLAAVMPGAHGQSGPGREKVPASAVVDGEPQGLFLGRSLLSGRAVCLLFLSGGRVTRAIPTGGLEEFDWARHRTEHEGDTGRWRRSGNMLEITWSGGGIHRGPLTITAGGIEFYGKRYLRPVAVTLEQLAGEWEAARGTAVVGGDGVNAVDRLQLTADGRFRWTGVTGGTVAGRAAAGGGIPIEGEVVIEGSTITLIGSDGRRVTRTLLPVAGSPISAFSVDGSLFTRVR